MPILGIWASSFRSAAGPVGAYDALATVTVPSGGLATVEFAGIPTGYKHLQLRILGKQTGSGPNQPLLFRINGSTGSYAVHNVNGNGSTAAAQGYANEADIFFADQMANSSQATEIYSAFIIDILDYENTNKFKTVRGLGGFDANGSGRIALNSALLQSTSAVSSIKFTPNSGNFSVNSQFALYGIK
jgi:hypothetical protein